MRKTKQCAECQSTTIYTTTISSGGGYSPDHLPGAHAWYTSGKLEIYICGKCGHLQYFVPAEFLPGVARSKKFKKHSS